MRTRSFITIVYHVTEFLEQKLNSGAPTNQVYPVLLKPKRKDNSEKQERNFNQYSYSGKTKGTDIL
jgi:hypothetical protein